MVAGGPAWLLGVCMTKGGMHGEEGVCGEGGACMARGACMVKGGICGEGGCAWDTMRYGDNKNAFQ